MIIQNASDGKKIIQRLQDALSQAPYIILYVRKTLYTFEYSEAQEKSLVRILVHTYQFDRKQEETELHSGYVTIRKILEYWSRHINLIKNKKKLNYILAM